LDACRWRNIWKAKVGVITDTYKDNIVDPLEKKGNHRIIRGGAGTRQPSTREVPIAVIINPLPKETAWACALSA